MVAGHTGILVTGGGTFLGNHITAALLAEGAEVRLLVRSGAEALLGQLKDEVEWMEGDVWNPASLRGRARTSKTVIHTVGGMKDDRAQGLTYSHLNFLSLRNVANMCVTDGAPHCMFISAAQAPWLPRPYLESKREAERYLARVGLKSTVIRAPVLYQRGKPRPTLYRMISFAAWFLPTLNRSAPMPIDIFARGVARLALNPNHDRTLFYARDLRRLNTRDERRGIASEPIPAASVTLDEPPLSEADTQPNKPVGF